MRGEGEEGEGVGEWGGDEEDLEGGRVSYAEERVGERGGNVHRETASSETGG